MNMIENPVDEVTVSAVKPRTSLMGRALMILGLSAGAMATAQVEPVVPPATGTKAPPPLRRPAGPGGPGGPAKVGEPRFPRPGSNISPFQSEGFEKLPEDEKKRVRAAMEKAWSLPALQQAKDRYMKANEAFRTAMRQALQEVDPEVVKILEKIKPQQPPGPRQLPKLPAPTEEGFARAAVDRLGMELMAFARPEVREKARGIHEKIMQSPAVSEAVNKLFAAPPDKRVEALGKLREAYREAVSKELPNLPRPQQRPASADASGPPATPLVVPESQKQ